MQIKLMNCFSTASNGEEERYGISCYSMLSDWTTQDYIDEYEETGDSPAFSFPEGVQFAINDKVRNLKEHSLVLAKEAMEIEKEEQIMLEDNATYYMLGTSLIGKREKDKPESDKIFGYDKWVDDEVGLIKRLLAGEDLTKQTLEDTDPEFLVWLNNSIKEIDRETAMEYITRQTIAYLKEFVWKETLAAKKEEWEKDPLWYAKYVHVDFVMNGIECSLYPSDLPFDSITSRDGFMEYVMSDICNDIKERGGHIIQTYGMSD